MQNKRVPGLNLNKVLLGMKRVNNTQRAIILWREKNMGAAQDPKNNNFFQEVLGIFCIICRCMFVTV